MMDKCDRHGPQFGLLVSPDVAQHIAAETKLSGCREVVYEYLGVEAPRFVVSAKFASEEGVDSGTSVPLPDDFPPWVKKLVPACQKCAEEATGLIDGLS